MRNEPSQDPRDVVARAAMNDAVTLIGLVAGATNAQPAHTWLLFGAIATAIFALAWKPLSDDDATPVKAPAATRERSSPVSAAPVD